MVEVVLVVVLELVVDGVVVVAEAELEEDLLLRPLGCGAAEPEVAVSLALRWPKLAASLLVISVTAPLSAPPPFAARTVTSLTRARLVAVGVDLITRRRMRCCSPEAPSATAARQASVRQTVSFMVFLDMMILSEFDDINYGTIGLSGVKIENKACVITSTNLWRLFSGSRQTPGLYTCRAVSTAKGRAHEITQFVCLPS